MKTHYLFLPLLIALLGFPQMSETMMTPSLPGIAAGLGGDPQLSMSIFFIAFALGVSFWGFVSDFSGRRKALLWGLLLFILGSALCAISQTLTQLFLSTFVQALGASAGSVVTQTILRDVYVEKEERSKVFAIIGMSLAFSPAMGPLLGSFLDDFLGWRFNFLAMAIIGVMLLGWILGTLQETRPQDQVSRSFATVSHVAKTMWRDPFIWQCSLIIGLCNAVLFCFFAEGPYIFIHALGSQPAEYGWIGIVVSLSTFLAGSINHRLASRRNAEELITCGAITMFAGATLFVTAAYVITLIGGRGLLTALWLTPSLFIIFLGMGMMISNCLCIALKNYQNVVGSAGSIFGMTYYIILAGLTAIMGLLHGNSILILPIYLAILSALTLVVAIKLSGSLKTESRCTR
ncbi:MAG: multidrug effflux MFS transporter [Chlamydiales bacterium]|nr:multidrug effflux MFS transporter [Chlamydiales bacterium]